MIFRLILGAVLSYLLGSLNFGIILSRKFQKEDVRTHGSGNAGSTNMLRNYGKLPAVATILGDMAKVAVAILLVRLLVGNDLYAQQPIFIKSFAGLFCVLGHIFPCFFRFKGGKGVATCGGMVFMIDWRIALILLAVFFVSMYTDGYWWGVAGSVISVLAVNFAFRTPYFAFNFTIPENIFSGVVMLVVSFMTSTLTTRIKKQEQLRMESEAEKMRANLLRAVSHDLRTPLTSIYGACSTVIDNYDSLGREQKIKLLSEACADAQWLNRMVENLLSVTRIDADGVAVQKTPTVLEELVDTVLVRFQKLHPGVPVEVKLPDDFIVIPMDSMLIQQVLTNLLENAVLHAKGMTRLTLRVFTLGQRAVFEVIDNGCGIPKERLKTLFTGTTLTQDTSSGGKHGMGIGLSVCAAIIKAHGGEIKAESTPGEGTTIRFWLETEEVDTEETEDEQ